MKVSDKTVKINLRDLAELVLKFDRNEPGALERFLDEVNALATDAPETVAQARVARIEKEGREKWMDRDKSKKESAGAFVNRVYGDLIQGETPFHTGTLQQYDRTLATTYDRWVEKVSEGKAEPLPDHPLPTSGRVKRHSDDDTPPPTEEQQRWVLRHRAREKKAREAHQASKGPSRL